MIHFVLEQISKAGQMNWVQKVLIYLFFMDASSWTSVILAPYLHNSFKLLFFVVRQYLSEALLSSFDTYQDWIKLPYWDPCFSLLTVNETKTISQDD